MRGNCLFIALIALFRHPFTTRLHLITTMHQEWFPHVYWERNGKCMHYTTGETLNWLTLFWHAGQIRPFPVQKLHLSRERKTQ